MADRRSLLMSVAHGVRRVWWQLRRPIVVGVMGVVVDERDHVLLVRPSYGTRHWTLPGGGVKRGESLSAAVARELHEEAGIVVPDASQLSLQGMYVNFKQGKNDHVAVFIVRTWRREASHDMEISNSGFFALDDLPEPVSGATKRRIEEFLGLRTITPEW